MSAPPNILLITSDQQHWNTLGAHNPEVTTPSLDRLAAEGTRFDRAYCPNPTCTPTRASIITGLYPSQHGAYSLGTQLAERGPFLGDRLEAAGYSTALVGKAHFQQFKDTPEYPSVEGVPKLHDFEYWRKFRGPFYGFRHVELARNHVDEHLVGQHYALWMEEQGFKAWRDCFRKPTGTRDPQRHRWNLPERYHQNAWIAERCGALIDEYARGEGPFFLWASFFDPHPPYLVPEPWDRLYDPSSLTVPAVTPGEHERNPPHFRLTQQARPDFAPWRESGQGLHGMHSHLHDRDSLARDIAVYYGMVSLLDKYVGVVLDHLERAGLAETTLVVFTSDHGHFFGQHGLIAKGPFHYEDMIRVPFLARWPGRIPSGRRSAALQSLVDLAPTFLSAAGRPGAYGMAGVDQQPAWTGERDRVRDGVVVENRHEPTTIHLKTYVDHRYKLTVYYGRTYGELFDLEEDPGEVRNLWDDPARAALKADLFRRLVDQVMAEEPLSMPRVSGA